MRLCTTARLCIGFCLTRSSSPLTSPARRYPQITRMTHMHTHTQQLWVDSIARVEVHTRELVEMICHVLLSCIIYVRNIALFTTHIPTPSFYLFFNRFFISFFRVHFHYALFTLTQHTQGNYAKQRADSPPFIFSFNLCIYRTPIARYSRLFKNIDASFVLFSVTTNIPQLTMIHCDYFYIRLDWEKQNKGKSSFEAKTHVHISSHMRACYSHFELLLPVPLVLLPSSSFFFSSHWNSFTHTSLITLGGFPSGVRRASQVGSSREHHFGFGEYRPAEARQSARDWFVRACFFIFNSVYECFTQYACVLACLYSFLSSSLTLLFVGWFQYGELRGHQRWLRPEQMGCGSNCADCSRARHSHQHVCIHTQPQQTN